MNDFRWIEDVEDWLAPMGYEAFWREITPHHLVLEYRSVCDAQIATGQIDRETVLFVLKDMARRELVQRHRLGFKPRTRLTVIAGGEG